jgi:hypothetical protein
MDNLVLSPPALGFVVGTRAALAFGVALLVANRIPEPRRKAMALTLIGVGAATTIPAVRMLLRSRRHKSERAFAGSDEPGHELRTVADL